jgi:hypothetical protein
VYLNFGVAFDFGLLACDFVLVLAFDLSERRH